MASRKPASSASLGVSLEVRSRLHDQLVHCHSSSRRLSNNGRGRRAASTKVPLIQGLRSIQCRLPEHIPMVCRPRQFATYPKQVKWCRASKCTEGFMLKGETPWLPELSYQHWHRALRDEPVFHQRSFKHRGGDRKSGPSGMWPNGGLQELSRILASQKS